MSGLGCQTLRHGRQPVSLKYSEVLHSVYSPSGFLSLKLFLNLSMRVFLGLELAFRKGNLARVEEVLPEHSRQSRKLTDIVIRVVRSSNNFKLRSNPKRSQCDIGCRLW